MKSKANIVSHPHTTIPGKFRYQRRRTTKLYHTGEWEWDWEWDWELTDLYRSCVSHALRVRRGLLHRGKVQNRGLVSAGDDKLRPGESQQAAQDNERGARR